MSPQQIVLPYATRKAIYPSLQNIIYYYTGPCSGEVLLINCNPPSPSFLPADGHKCRCNLLYASFCC